jgi:hypothetical protein
VTHVDLRITAATRRERDRALRELEQLFGARLAVGYVGDVTQHIGGAQRWAAWCRLEAGGGASRVMCGH